MLKFNMPDKRKKEKKDKLSDLSLSDGIEKLSTYVAKEQVKTELAGVIEHTENKAKAVSEEIVRKEIEILKKDILVIFGIFASFIAFIVGEINILKTIDSIYDKLGFSFIFVALMLGFLFGVMFLLGGSEIEKKYRKMGIVFSLFFLIGLSFILLPNLQLF